MKRFEDWTIHIAWMDVKNFFQFRKEIGEEMSYNESMFNKLKLQRNKLGNVVYLQHDFTDAELMGADFNIQRMVANKANKIITYFNDTLHWFEYVDFEVSNFVEEDTGEPTMSYMFVISYKPIVFSMKWFWKWFGIIFGSICGISLVTFLVYEIITMG